MSPFRQHYDSFGPETLAVLEISFMTWRCSKTAKLYMLSVAVVARTSSREK
jgi:hypothetical protein